MRIGISFAFTVLLSYGLSAGAVAQVGQDASWPQWGGPTRDFQVPAKGLANQWPKDGPRALWSRPLGEGHSAICVDGDAMYTMFSQGEQEIVVAAAVATGKTVWEHRYDSPTKGMDLGEGKGPHATPLVVGDLLFTVGTIGKMHAFDKRTGMVVWFHDLWGELGGVKLDQGYACSPIAYKDTVIVTVGGRGQAVVAFRQKDGAIAWKKHDFAKSPASPLLINVDGQDQLVVFFGDAIVGLNPANGDLLWQHPHKTKWGLNISTPVWGKGNLLFCSSAYDGGSRVLKLTQKAGQTTVEELWFSRKFRIHMGNAIRIDDHIYGCSGDFAATLLSAVNVMTGAIAWQVRFPKASLLYADGRFLILDETGQLSLATLSPEGMKIHCKATVLGPTAWTVPTLVGRTLYLRDRKTVKALDLSASQPGPEASEKSKDYRFTSGQSALNIPFEEDDGHIRLRLRLNGSEPCWFGLDTGAIRSVVDKRKSQTLGLRLEGGQRVGGAGGTEEATIIKHLDLQLPGAELLDQTAWALPLDFLSAAKGRELAGILGYELFSHFVVEIDYAAQRMHLYEPRTYEYRGPGESVPIGLRDGEVYVKAKVVAPGREPVEGQFVIDTGSANTLLLAKAFIDKHKLRNSVSKTVPVRGRGVGGPVHMAMGRLAKLQLGSFALDGPITGFVDVGEIAEPDEAGNIGGRFLRRFRIIFDYSRKRMILEPGKYFSEPEEFDMSGARLVAEGATLQQIRVVGVREKSPAAHGGLRPQDLILKIDDQRADVLTLSKIKELFRRDGREYSLLVKRGEQELKIKLTLRRLI